MPQLPKIPWMAKRNPSAKVVQDLYIATRQEEMEITSKPMRDKAYDVLCGHLLSKLDPKKKQKIPYKELQRAYRMIEQNLQSADLTVNFSAVSWFTNENNYDTYTQMYERAMQGGVMVLKGTAMNPAEERASTDNRVTFPQNWYAAKTETNAPSTEKRGENGVRGGLSPTRQGTDRIMRQMDTGGLISAGATKADGFYASEKYFNPHTKQLFFGLNYGRRRHGPATDYGKSYMVVKGDLKPKCIYYACDTFLRMTRNDHAGDIQYSYDNLGAILGDSMGLLGLRGAILESCYEGNPLPDAGAGNDMMYSLIEAHYFGELRFRDHLDYVAISPKDVKDMKLWPQIVANATKFCNRQGIPLYLRSA